MQYILAQKNQDQTPDTSNQYIYVEFQCTELMRFLSHAELLRTLNRCCVRAQLSIKYSQGFNPRARISLPLPKAVGLNSKGDLLCFQLNQGHPYTNKQIQNRLSEHTPKGISVLSVYTSVSKCSLQPYSADIIIPINKLHINEILQNKINEFMASTNTIVERKKPANRTKIKKINIRQFVSSIQNTDQGITLTCLITPGGSVRIDEILTILALNREKLSGAIRRRNIQWLLN